MQMKGVRVAMKPDLDMDQTSRLDQRPGSSYRTKDEHQGYRVPDEHRVYRSKHELKDSTTRQDVQAGPPARNNNIERSFFAEEPSSADADPTG